MAVSEEYRLWIVDQLSTVAPVRTRRMFGGLGIYAGDLFFAIADDDVLYFKVSDATRPDYEAAGAHPFQPSPDAPEMTGYWSVPADVLVTIDEVPL
jgi:DNA transformation protein